MRSRSASAVTSVPSITRLGSGVAARSGECSSPRMCISVLLPQPDGPMMPTISPASTDTSTPRSARTWLFRLSRYVLCRLCASRNAIRLPYPYRSASTGSRRAAFHAGSIPASAPNTVEKVTPITAIHGVSRKRTVPEVWPASLAK